MRRAKRQRQVPIKSTERENHASDTNSAQQQQHGVNGVYYGGKWLDLGECHGEYSNTEKWSTSPTLMACPRSKSRNATRRREYDVLIVGAGCVGAAIARELSRYSLSVLWIEDASDVTGGLTSNTGNLGIVHTGYSEKPGTNRAKYCWVGNQMFPGVDRELRFGYKLNGSLVIAMNKDQVKMLHEMKKRAETNGVQKLRIVNQDELREMEPRVNPNAVAALHSPDTGTVNPNQFTIALSENAVDNGVELRIRRKVTKMENKRDYFEVELEHWEPKEYADAMKRRAYAIRFIVMICFSSLIMVTMGTYMALDKSLDKDTRRNSALATYAVVVGGALVVLRSLQKTKLPLASSNLNNKAVSVSKEVVRATYVINCAAGASDKIARMVGDDSFSTERGLRNYLVFNQNRGDLVSHTLVSCPESESMSQGASLQTSLEGNLTLALETRTTVKPDDASADSVQEEMLAKGKALVPSLDPDEICHAFWGAHDTSDRGDWIIEASTKNPELINVAGIDCIAGCPAIALEVVQMLRNAGLGTPRNASFTPDRAPIIFPKGCPSQGALMNSTADGIEEAKMAATVICKHANLTELDVVRMMRRSLPIDSSKAIRMRIQAGTEHCDGDPHSCDCEERINTIVARENRGGWSRTCRAKWKSALEAVQKLISNQTEAA